MRIPATLVRGGTSKCWLFNSQDVPASKDQIESLLIDAFNAADPRQIDGVGGATSTTSKAAVVSQGAERGVDVDYLFAQVGIGDSRVEWGSNCGNCATAIALYAVSHGLVQTANGTTVVRMRNLNTGARLEADVDTPGGTLPAFGDAQVPGTLATGVPVTLAFLDAGGGTTGAVLPTGRAQEQLNVDGRQFTVSMIDAGAPMVLVEAASLGLTGSESLAEMSQHVPLLTSIRSAAAVQMGLREADSPVDHAVPKVGVVGAARDYTTAGGKSVAATEYDVAVRTLSMHAPHPAIGLTSAVGLTTAAITPGTIVHSAITRNLRKTADGATVLQIGTAAGPIITTVTTDPANGGTRIGLQRAARIISESILFTREAAAAGISA
ncbi:PrpF domain-containing protein [Arthrobacter sp.]|uniref:PrpF domain-containing protein n=1 Tax=Arthrobacter sp. TaxID=1667 RepID=UPI00258AB280|nr:PrpF domain-containing protein [Arthrobacter sp.]